MDDETKKEETKKEETTKKEVTPTWAKNLQESLDSLPSRLSELLNPQEDSDPDPKAPQEIPVPEPPKQDTPEPEHLTDPEPEQPKKRKFLDWLL